MRSLLKKRIFVCSDHFQQILSTQLDLVDAGHITEAQELEVFKSEVVFGSQESSQQVENVDTLHPKIQEMRKLLEEGNAKNIATE